MFAGGIGAVGSRSGLKLSSCNSIRAVSTAPCLLYGMRDGVRNIFMRRAGGRGGAGGGAVSRISARESVANSDDKFHRLTGRNVRDRRKSCGGRGCKNGGTEVTRTGCVRRSRRRS